MKTKKLLGFFVFFDLIVLIFLVAFFYLNPEKQKIDANVRNITPGDFVELSEGFVHYELSGAPEGELVVLVHGFSVPYYVWDPTVDELVKQGYRVLRYDCMDGVTQIVRRLSTISISSRHNYLIWPLH